MNVEKFECFDVYKIDEGSSFVYVNYKDKESFIEGLVDYAFSEYNLLNYARRKNKIIFEGTDRQYVQLFKNISRFLNRQLESYVIIPESDVEKKALEEEYSCVYDNGKLIVQNDKIGKIGEYIFHILLSEYYKLDCVLPKFERITDRNMSIYGIDALFLDSQRRILYFGESKFCKDIDHGINLINRSLKDYEEQIKEEYLIVLSADDVPLRSPEFKRLFGQARQISITFEKFIKTANITQIGVPIFIAHGNEDEEQLEPDKYLDKMLTKIHKKNFFDLMINYIFISLPVLDKELFVEKAIKKAVEKHHEYERKSP